MEEIAMDTVPVLTHAPAVGLFMVLENLTRAHRIDVEAKRGFMDECLGDDAEAIASGDYDLSRGVVIYVGA